MARRVIANVVKVNGGLPTEGDKPPSKVNTYS